VAVTKKLAGEVVMMDILTGSLKLRDENGIEHKIKVAGRYLMEIDPGDKVEVEIRRGKTKSIMKIPAIQAAHPEPVTESGQESEKSEVEKGNS
jgi:translation initiation factor IF-1